MNHTYIIESNRQTAYRDVYEATKNRTANTSDTNMPNHEWKTYIENGVPVEKGDIIQVEATQINLRGDESEEIELTGGGTNPGRNPISDNKTTLEYGFYMANRQEFNFPLPLASHQIHFNPADPKHGSPNMEVMRRFMNTNPVQTVQGFGVKLNTSSADIGKYELITALNSRTAGWMPDFTYCLSKPNADPTQPDTLISADVNFGIPTSMSLPPVTNGPLSIFHPNQVRMYKMGKNVPPLFPIFKKAAANAEWDYLTPKTENDLLQTSSVDLEIPAGFHTPTSVAANLTAQLQQKTGDGDSWETDEPAIQYTRRMNQQGRDGAPTQSTTTSLKVNDYSTATYKICNTASGDFCEAYSNGEFRGAYYGAKRSIDTSVPLMSGEAYMEVDGFQLLYKNMLCGDVPRYVAAYNWGLFQIIGDGEGNDPGFRLDGSQVMADSLTVYNNIITTQGLRADKVYVDWGAAMPAQADLGRTPGLLGPNVVFMDNMDAADERVDEFTFCNWLDGRSGGGPSILGGLGNAQQETVNTLLFNCLQGCPFPTNILCTAAAVKIAKAAFTAQAHPGPASGATEYKNVGQGIDGIYAQYVVDLQFGRLDDQYTSTTTRQYGANESADGNWGALNGNEQVLTNQMNLPNCLSTYKLRNDPHGPSGSRGDYDWSPTYGREAGVIDPAYAPSTPAWAAYSDIQVPYNIPLDAAATEPISKTVPSINPAGGVQNLNMGLAPRYRHIASAKEEAKYRVPFYAFWSDFMETLDDGVLPPNSFFTFFDPDGNRFPSDIFKPQNGDKGIGACGLFIRSDIDPNMFPWLNIGVVPGAVPGATTMPRYYYQPYMAFFAAETVNPAGSKPNRLIPRPRVGEFFGFSPSFQDLKCAKIINTQSIDNNLLFNKVAQNYSQQDLDKTLVGRQLYDYETPEFGVPAHILPYVPAQTFSPFDYVSYVHIGADNPTVTFSSTGSGKFEINQLHTAIRVSNSTYANSQATTSFVVSGTGTSAETGNYSANDGFADPILEMYSIGKSVVSQYYGGGMQHPDSLWKEGLENTSGAVNTSDGTLAYKRVVQYAMSTYEAVTNNSGTVGMPANTGGPYNYPPGPPDNKGSNLWEMNKLATAERGVAYLHPPTFVLRALPYIFVQQVVDKICPINSAQSGIAITALTAPQADNDSLTGILPITSDRPYRFAGTLFDKLGFSIEQLIPFVGKQNTLFNRQTQSQYLGFNQTITNKYHNMVKPVTTNGFVSGALSLAFTANSFTTPLENLGAPTWLLPQTTEQVSDSIIAVKLPKKLAYPYLVLNSNIVEQKSTYYGSKFTTTIPTLAYLARNYNVADFTYTFQTDWTYQVDKDHIITDFDIQILTPEGNPAPLDDNSSVIFKIIKEGTPAAQMATVPIKKSSNKK